MKLLRAFLLFLTVAGTSLAEGTPLQPLVDAAEPGAVLRLSPGLYDGPVVISHPLTLLGGKDVQVVGPGVGSVVTIDALEVRVEGLQISGSGDDHENKDAGIRLLKGAKGAVVRGNTLQGNLYGIDVHGAKDAQIIGNVIEGRQGHRMNQRGNGVYLWNAAGTVVEGNDMRWGRDGIFVNTSKRNVFKGNRFRDLRFAVHYMYANDSEVSGNLSIGNHLGFAVMYSRNVKVLDNISIGDRDHGVMLNFTNRSKVQGNYVQDGAKKCLFVYNAHQNEISGNRFERCGIGIHFTAGSERNDVIGNAFIGNRTQVKYVSTKWLDWAVDGQGNYWSDFVATDLDGNGIADGTYRPNDTIDQVLWQQPAARLLLGSPAVQLVQWAQSAFPALTPGGVMDTAPLMQPVEISVPDWGTDYDG
ncbi:nitrous oxide reductase family maturation protein NosD [Marivita sp. S6314]|uniref:nitrous oxide reductase family maturation protein NosD n=1 Tax=Marivita sp. S6314 TaxID=2926406 RepID=UPI001FF14A85|nr:nitrous oxide reductase family maturation protein NosD [Marivita sp. S6314]MCK0150458.1 nitrous oxide reductase family maturation protein NosD [Marivita sp. S6314]